MDDRLDLQRKLMTFSDNVYFQPPANIRIIYPCIIYRRISKRNDYGNDDKYLKKQEYEITVIDKNPI
jgi:hypothetical protein